MNLQPLDRKTRSVCQLIGNQNYFQKFYLAGGSATAIYLGHRYSFDLDFFTTKHFNHLILAEHLKKLGKLSVDTLEKDTFLGRLDTVKISFFRYAYPLLYPTVKISGIAVADLRDITAMKIDAIGARGTRRDFTDLFFILNGKGWSLDQAIKWYRKKYAGLNVSLLHVLKSLTYFDDAERDQPPQMIKLVNWTEVKKFFEEAVRSYKF